jgi:hypothetical protein
LWTTREYLRAPIPPPTHPQAAQALSGGLEQLQPP